MTEAEWLTCEDSDAMLNCVQDSASVRKLRLFCVACCRHLMHLVFFPEFVGALDAAEAHADCLINDEALREARQKADFAVQEGRASGVGYNGVEAAVIEAAEWWLPNGYLRPLAATSYVAERARWASARYFPDRVYPPFPAVVCVTWPPTSTETQAHIRALEEFRQAEDALDTQLSALEARKQAVLVRDIFGNPFRPVAFNPAWRTDTAVSLARGMYESRDFSAMPILADALQDAGCEDEQVLNHCRDANQPHVRGCWVCDLVLGKA